MDNYTDIRDLGASVERHPNVRLETYTCEIPSGRSYVYLTVTSPTGSSSLVVGGLTREDLAAAAEAFNGSLAVAWERTRTRLLQAAE